MNTRLPEMFRPLLWGLRWEDIDLEKNKTDIILNIINEGTLEQWRWLIKTYGKKVIRQTLAERLASELHPESRELARIVFDLPTLKHAR